MVEMLKKQFDDEALRLIIDQALTYRCACPAQVAELILKSRAVHDYEVQCLENADDDLPDTHRAIAQTVGQAHELLEACLDHVLHLEGWDRETLEMPEGLRKKVRMDPS